MKIDGYILKIKHQIKTFPKSFRVYLKMVLFTGMFLLSSFTLNEKEQLSPEVFLTPERFSVISKYIFTKYFDKNIHVSYHYDLYKDVLRVLSPNFIEGNSKTKNSYEIYVSEFINLIKDIKDRGFDSSISCIPYSDISGIKGKEYFIDGEHRVGASLYFRNFLTCQKIDANDKPNNYGSSLLIANKVNENYLDHMAFEYLKLNDKSTLVLLYSRAMHDPQKALTILEKYGRTVYTKKVTLNCKGATNLVKLLYELEPHNINAYWHTPLSGDAGKANAMMEGASSATFMVVLWDCDSLEINKKCKQEIREAYPPFCQDTLHIPDYHEEAIYVGQVLFNQNSINFLNHVKPIQFNKFNSYASNFKQFLKQHPELEEDYVIDTGAVLSGLGIRDCQDFDIICHDEKADQFKNLQKEGIDIHNRERHEYHYNIHELIYIPSNHFYYKGLRFLSPRNIIEYKTRRKSGQKDIEDIRAIKKLNMSF